jgi:hypothetical protein
MIVLIEPSFPNANRFTRRERVYVTTAVAAAVLRCLRQLTPRVRAHERAGIRDEPVREARRRDAEPYVLLPVCLAPVRTTAGMVWRCAARLRPTSRGSDRSSMP